MTIDEFAAELDDVARRIDNEPADVALEQCRNLILCDITDNFDKSTSPDGTAWPPRQLAGDGHPLLIETRALIDAATGKGAGSMSEIDGRELQLGIDGSIIPYAATHNFGDPVRNIPQREFIGAKEETLKECGDLIADDLLNRFWM